MSISISAILTALEHAPAEAGAVLSFIQNTVTAVEGTSKSGADKLTAVLNSTQTFINSALPGVIADIESFMTAVAAFVNELVALYHEAGVFVHALGIK